MSYGTKVYKRQGGDAMVVASGGKLVMQTGAKLVPNSETQAANIAAVQATSAGNFTTAERDKFNLVLVALKGVGILATS